MKHINFYQKYRPQKFANILEQSETIAVLKNVIIQNKIHHAYLFTGMQGVGKTSMARIFAQAVNCTNNQLGELCQQCEVCQQNQQLFQDIIEIDAASHNGVEEIRNLKANAIVKPAVARYKVYIVDEVHMLSKSAFNAFLKLLEEPPRHVIFILATTEINKVPETILSRCQVFYFQPITNHRLATFLADVAKKELLSFDFAAMEAIAKHTQGLVRDALNILEQIAFAEIGQKITANRVAKYLGVLNESLKKTFFTKLLQQAQTEVTTMIDTFAKNNVDFQHFTEQLLILTKELIVHKIQTPNQKVHFLNLPQLSLATLEKVVSILLVYHPRFQMRLQKQLIFEIMCMQIFVLLKNAKTTPKTASATELTFNDQENRVNLEEALALLNNRQSTLLTSLKNKWSQLDNYAQHWQFGKLVKLLTFCALVAGSQDSLLLRSDSSLVRNQINNLNHHPLLISFSETFFGKVYQFKVLTSDELTALRVNFYQKQ